MTGFRTQLKAHRDAVAIVCAALVNDVTPASADEG
jgi:hypothetical protein